VNVTNALIAINVIVFVWELTSNAFVRDPSLVGHGALDGPDVLVNHQYWRIVSGAFLHGSYMHIGFNMLALYTVGTAVERALGGPRMLAVYTLSMVGSGLAVVFFSYDSATVGASGAIFGLFGALVGIGLRLGAPGRGLIAQVLPIVILNLVFTFALPGISAAAHIGGLLTGFLVGILVFEMRRPQLAFAPADAATGAESASFDEAAVDAIEHNEIGHNALGDSRIAANGAEYAGGGFEAPDRHEPAQLESRPIQPEPVREP
jgi:membrane associated rhomboid family serine protease